MALKTFSVNEYFTNADANTYIAQQAVAIKTATESVTSSTTLQDDNELSVTLVANGVYWLDMWLLTDGNVSGDIKLALFIPSGTLRWMTNGLRIGGSTTIDSVNRKVLAGGAVSGTDVGTAGSGTTSLILPRGIARIGSTGGLGYLRWAQNTSSSTATRILAGSMMRWTRIK